MSDEHLSLTSSAPPPPTEADYEAIAAAVMETVRGRWFLGEYARRNRNADTEQILEGLDRIETLARARPPEVSPAERVRIDLVEMARAIAQMRAEIAAIKPDGDAKGTLSEATEELDSIVHTTERATSDILAAAEQVQEIAWTLRERGADGGICDSLDQRATDIYSACSFQDLTGQRTRKVVEVLRFLENRIQAMIEIWGGAVADMAEKAAVAAPHVGEDPNVPHLAQGEIDRMMPSARSDTPAPSPNGHDAAAYEARTFPAPAAGRAAAAASAAPGPTGGETAMTPAAAIVGATALALDFEVARQSESRAEPEPQGEAEPQGELERQPEPQAEPEARAAPEPHAEPEPQAEPDSQSEVEAQGEVEPTPAFDVQPEAMAQPAFESEPIADAEVIPDERPDPAAVLKRILAIIRAPNDPSAELAAPGSPSPAPNTAALAPSAPPRIEAALMATAEPPTATEVPVATETLAAAAAPAAPIAADAVVTDLLTPEETALDVAGAIGASPDEGVAPTAEPTAAAARFASASEVASDDMPFAASLTVEQAVDEMLTRARPQAPPAPAEPVPSEPIAPTEPIRPEAPEWSAAPIATAAEPIAEQSAPAEAVSPRASLVIEMPELTVAHSVEPAPQAVSAPEPAPVRQPEFGSEPAPQPAPAMPAAAIAEAAASASQTMLPDLLPTPAAAPAPVAIPAPAPVPEPAPSAGSAVPTPARHEALAAIAALSDDEKIALFS